MSYNWKNDPGIDLFPEENTKSDPFLHDSPYEINEIGTFLCLTKSSVMTAQRCIAFQKKKPCKGCPQGILILAEYERWLARNTEDTKPKSHKKMKKYPVVCQTESCGKIFYTHAHHKAKWCPDCRPEQYAKMQRKARERRLIAKENKLAGG